jgi:hypothetical protein
VAFLVLESIPDILERRGRRVTKGYNRKEAPIVAIETERNYGGMTEQVRRRNRQQVESHRGFILAIMDRMVVGTSHDIALVPFSCPR